MNVRSVKLHPESSDKLCELFAQERDCKEELMVWQDRSPDFFKAYEHFASGPILGWGLEDTERGQLIASNCKVPYESHFFERTIPTFYTTDLFVSPQNRHKGEYKKLIKDVTMDLKDFLKGGTFLGVENIPQSLNKLSPWTSEGGAHLWFPGETHLYESYLTTSLGFESKREFDFHQIPISKINTELLQKIIDKLNSSAKKFPFFPKISMKILKKMLKVDSQSRFLISFRGSKMTAFVFLIDFKKYRRLRWTGKSSVILERMRRRKDLYFDSRSLDADEICKTLVESMYWSDPAYLKDLQALMEQSYNIAFKEGYHCLMSRDVQPECLPQCHDRAHYARRLFVSYLENDEILTEEMKLKLNDNLFWRLDGGFL